MKIRLVDETTSRVIGRYEGLPPPVGTAFIITTEQQYSQQNPLVRDEWQVVTHRWDFDASLREMRIDVIAFLLVDEFR